MFEIQNPKPFRTFVFGYSKFFDDWNLMIGY